MKRLRPQWRTSVPNNVKSNNQTEATEVTTAVMERKSVILPEEVPPTAEAAVTTNGGKSAEAIVP